MDPEDDDELDDAVVFLPKKAIRGALGGRQPLGALQRVCVECEVSCDSGDATTKCQGCQRLFHTDCAKISSNDKSASSFSWKCAPCSVNAVRCDICMNFELCDATSVCEVEGCHTQRCEECSSTGGPWKCPLHVCGGCEAEVETGTFTWRCVRCPRAFHQTCRPMASHLIASEVIKCVRHVTERLPELDKSKMAMRRRKVREARVHAGYNRVLEDAVVTADFAPVVRKPKAAPKPVIIIPKRKRPVEEQERPVDDETVETKTPVEEAVEEQERPIEEEEEQEEEDELLVGSPQKRPQPPVEEEEVITPDLVTAEPSYGGHDNNPIIREDWMMQERSHPRSPPAHRRQRVNNFSNGPNSNNGMSVDNNNNGGFSQGPNSNNNNNNNGTMLMSNNKRAKKRGTICTHYVRGQCTYGEGCRFEHPRGGAASSPRRQYDSSRGFSDHAAVLDPWSDLVGPHQVTQPAAPSISSTKPVSLESMLAASLAKSRALAGKPKEEPATDPAPGNNNNHLTTAAATKPAVGDSGADSAAKEANRLFDLLEANGLF